MVYVQSRTSVLDFWTLPLSVALRPTAMPAKFIADGRNAAYSPDGSTIAFESERSGITNIWLSNADGSRPVQLTTSKEYSGTPRWSPDGRRLVFDSLEGANWDLYVVGADGGMPRRLTDAPSEDGTGAWSRDGRWIYFHSDRTGRYEVWKIPAGGGTAVQVTRTGGYYAEESKDGRDLYYTKHSPSGVWRVSLSGGEESEVAKGPLNWQSWALTRRGLYYAGERWQALHRRQEFTIQHLDFNSGRTTLILRREGILGHQSMTVSPDEKTVLFSEAPGWQSELMLIENFR